MSRFAFAFAPSYVRPAAFFGVRDDTALVHVTDEWLDARFGRWRVRTPRSNITAAELTGPFAYLKTAGPARLGITDRGLTFATNGDRGVLLTFAQRVEGIDRLGLIKHPELTVTVAEPERLVNLLSP